MLILYLSCNAVIANQYQDELSRRKTLGQHYSRVLATQLRIVQASEERHKTHRIQFDGLYGETMKSIEWMNALTSQTSVDPMMVERYYKNRFDNNTIIALCPPEVSFWA